MEGRLERCENEIPPSERQLLRAVDYDDPEHVDLLKAYLWQAILASDPEFSVEAFGYTTVPQKVVRFFSAICTACGSRFPVPNLGDFSYGLSILTTKSGRWFSYFESIANPIWEMIQMLFAEVAGDHLSHEETAELLQETLALCADPFSGEMFTHRDVCPICQEERSVYLSDVPAYDGTIPVTSFRDFRRLTPEERRARIAAIVEQLHPL